MGLFRRLTRSRSRSRSRGSRSESQDEGTASAAGSVDGGRGAVAALEGKDERGRSLDVEGDGGGREGMGRSGHGMRETSGSHSRGGRRDEEGVGGRQEEEGARQQQQQQHSEEKEAKQEGHALSRDDVRALFSGAPHFSLEPGHRARSFPQAFFPFAADPSLTDLLDHTPITHESFALATLHSHLPIPVALIAQQRHVDESELANKLEYTDKPASIYFPGKTTHTGSEPPDYQPKYTLFDLGIYERPNMISLHGVERGTVGFHAFLERGVADGMSDGMSAEERGRIVSAGVVGGGDVATTETMAAVADEAYVKASELEACTTKKHRSGSSGSSAYSSTGSSSSSSNFLNQQSATEAIRTLAAATKNNAGFKVKIGKHAKPHDRLEMLREGINAWSKLGVRPMSMQTITERLEQASELRNQIVKHGRRFTALQAEGFGEKEMGRYLFRDVLFEDMQKSDVDASINAAAISKSQATGNAAGAEDLEGTTGHSLQHQIEVLVKILSTPGAWLDFSLPKERRLFSFSLRTREVKSEVNEQQLDEHGIKSATKQWLNLTQLMLGVELVMRLDAAMRMGIAVQSEELNISAVEIHRFNKLRTVKVDWDLVVARRFLGWCYAKRMVRADHNLSSLVEQAQLEPQSATPTAERGAAFKLFHRHKSSTPTADQPPPDVDANWPYDCAIFPRRAALMVDGLVTFAQDIGWPAAPIAALTQAMVRKLCSRSLEDQEAILAHGIEPVERPQVPKPERERSRVELRAAGAETLGGPMSHSWFGGLIIPGYGACDMLMCALLENDSEQKAVERLGNIAYPRTGFVLGNRSWWSKVCLIAAVLAPMTGSKERMGWIGLPEQLMILDEGGQGVGEGWKLVVSQWGSRTSKRDVTRIHDGDDLAKQSSTLGVGKGHVLASEFKMVTDAELDLAAKKSVGKLHIGNVSLVLKKKESTPEQGEDFAGTPLLEANVVVSIREGTHDVQAAQGKSSPMVLPLRWTILFIAQHPCRPPHGHHGSPSTVGNEIRSPTMLKHKPTEHLPAHPLHCSFKYTIKSVADLLAVPEDAADPLFPNPHDHRSSPIWLIDARSGQWEEEVLVRAWCARHGLHALISRVGKGCIGCAVREARACEVGIVVRVR